MKKWSVGLLLIVAVTVAGWFSLDSHLRYLIMNPPADTNVLFWSTAQRDAGFRVIDKLPLITTKRVKKGESTRDLARGQPLSISTQAVEELMKVQRIAGLVVIHKGVIRLERYGLDFDANGKWTSFSVAKSFTSTLVGAALKDGAIKSLQDKVSDYIPDMRGSAYDNVTIEQLLTMTSGIAWNEDYGDPESDVSKFNFHKPDNGVDITASYMRTLSRDAEPGTKWLYSTGETNLIGLLVSQATGKDLASYLSEKVWSHIGVEHDASWIIGSTGHEISGCCIQASTRDFARFGQFVMQGAKVDGESIVPDNWFESAVRSQTDIGRETQGYGYQWWTSNDGSFQGRGIFGQGIFIDPARDLVVAINSNWPTASHQQAAQARNDLYALIQSSIDRE